MPCACGIHFCCILATKISPAHMHTWISTHRYKREECIKFLEEVEAASLKAFEAGDVEGDP